MNIKKNVIAICGSASWNSRNLSILKYIADLEKSEFDFEIIDNLADLPHFKTEQTDINVPEIIVDFRTKITNADGVIICTPEYIFSIPSRLKNAIEWCVSTTVLSNKPIGLISASANGEKAYEELKLIMETLQAKLTEKTSLLIQGVKGKVGNNGQILDKKTETELKKFVQSFKEHTKRHLSTK